MEVMPWPIDLDMRFKAHMSTGTRSDKACAILEPIRPRIDWLQGLALHKMVTSLQGLPWEEWQHSFKLTLADLRPARASFAPTQLK